MKTGFSKYVFIALILITVALSGCGKTDLSGADANDPNHEVIRQAVLASDPNICEQIGIQSGTNSKDTCYSILALATKNAALCENVKGVTTTETGIIDKTVCIEKVNNAIIRDMKVEQAKQIYEEAFDDPSACNQFEDATARDVCLENSAVKNADYTTCKMMGNDEGKQECLFRVALLVGDKSICNQLAAETGKFSQDLCFGSIAVNLLDPDVCEDISVQSGPFSRDACFGSIAVVTKEKALCDRVFAETGDLSREFCLDMLG